MTKLELNVRYVLENWKAVFPESLETVTLQMGHVELIEYINRLPVSIKKLQLWPSDSCTSYTDTRGNHIKFPFDNLPIHLEELHIVCCVGDSLYETRDIEKLDKLPASLEVLVLLFCYIEHPLDNLPSGLKTLLISSTEPFKIGLERLPSELEILGLCLFDNDYAHTLNNLPLSLKKFVSNIDEYRHYLPDGCIMEYDSSDGHFIDILY